MQNKLDEHDLLPDRGHGGQKPHRIISGSRIKFRTHGASPKHDGQFDSGSTHWFAAERNNRTSAYAEGHNDYRRA